MATNKNNDIINNNNNNDQQHKHDQKELKQLCEFFNIETTAKNTEHHWKISLSDDVFEPRTLSNTPCTQHINGIWSCTVPIECQYAWHYRA